MINHCSTFSRCSTPHKCEATNQIPSELRLGVPGKWRLGGGKVGGCYCYLGSPGRVERFMRPVPWEINLILWYGRLLSQVASDAFFLPNRFAHFRRNCQILNIDMTRTSKIASQRLLRLDCLHVERNTVRRCFRQGLIVERRGVEIHFTCWPLHVNVRL